VLVGPEGKEESFAIHKDLICANSKFFKAACSKLWTEGREKIVRLPEVKVEIFQAYIVWVYSGKVSVNGSPGSSAADKASAELNETTELYLLGDVLDDLQLRNAAMRAWVLKTKIWNIQPATSVINQVWDSTLPGSLFRKMIVDHTIMRFDRGGFEQLSEHYPKDLLHSIAVALMKKIPTVNADTFVAGVNGYLEPEISVKHDGAK
jgi:hypothetical protein